MIEHFSLVDRTLNAKGDMLPIIGSFMTEDSTFENPVGTPVCKGVAANADMSSWGQLHHISHAPVYVFVVDPNTLGAYRIVSIHFNDSHVTLPLITLYKWTSGKVSAQFNYWDSTLLQASPSPASKL